MRIVERRQGYFVIKSDTTVERIPFVCPLCTQVMLNDDIVTFKQFQCCSWCERMWISGKTDKWLSGWRPDSKVVLETLLGLGIIKCG